MGSDDINGLPIVLGKGDGSAPAIIIGSGGATYTRDQIHNLAIQFATTLRNSGISPGSIITIAEPNTIEFVVAFLGTTYARAVAAPLNQNYTKDEFDYYMEDAQSCLLVTGSDGNPAAEAAAKVPCISITITPSSSSQPTLSITLRNNPTPSFTLNQAPPTTTTLTDPPQPTDVALFLHTSGTTSRPKGVPLSHSNLLASLINISTTYEFTTQDRSLLVMPLFHVHGLMAGLLSPLFSGAAVVLPAAGKFSASTFWNDAVDNKVTFYTAVPTIHQVLVSRAATDYPKDTPPPLRVIRSCSSSLAPATLDQVERAFNAPVLEAYAMTEASHQMTSNPLPKHGAHKPGTVGKPQGTVKVAILNEQCELLPAGQIGEVCIQGPNVTSGYKNNDKANEEAFAGGWFHTGDQGYLDDDGYLTLTGRIKELINRGGEKISPLEVDAVLLSHPWIGEAVSFAAPDEKYGEVVAAAVVLNAVGIDAVEKQVKSSSVGGDSNTNSSDAVNSIVGAAVKEHCSTKLSSFKVPVQVFVTDVLPKNATGKIQRRFMVDAFITGKKDTTNTTTNHHQQQLPTNGFFLITQTLSRLGITSIFGVIGIPVTQLASAAQACGIRFISCRNEQAASYAASATGFLTGLPGVLLTVSGPGVIHGLSGVVNSEVNGWPMIMISGSCESGEVGKGSFQELDQISATSMYTKTSLQVKHLLDIPDIITTAYKACLHGSPAASYIDIPSDILMSSLDSSEEQRALELLNRVPVIHRDTIKDAMSGIHSRLFGSGSSGGGGGVDVKGVDAVIELLKQSTRPLVVIGTAAAYTRSESIIRTFINTTNIPFITSSMARGVVPDDHPLCVNAARSLALGQADVALVIGGKLNWQLHFGEPPKWSSDVKFILIDAVVTERDRSLAAVVLEGSIQESITAIVDELQKNSTTNDNNINSNSSNDTNDTTMTTTAQLLAERYQDRINALTTKATAARDKLALALQKIVYPLNYQTALRVIRDRIIDMVPVPIVVSEGANTMDQARMLLEPVRQPRCRLDAGIHGTMGVGPGYALAAAVSHPTTPVLAIEGDSAFGFSAMEVETASRYKLPIIFIVFNNGGIYGGDRREHALREMAEQGLKMAGYENDPAPTAFVPGSRYELLAEAFGCKGVSVETAEELTVALDDALNRCIDDNSSGDGYVKTTVINVKIDPMAGVESGNVHSFNAPKKS